MKRNAANKSINLAFGAGQLKARLRHIEAGYWGVEAVEKLRKKPPFDKIRHHFKKYNYSQSAMVVIDFEEQLHPGTFEFILHKLIDNHIDLAVFREKYSNDTGGRSACDPAILLKTIF